MKPPKDWPQNVLPRGMTEAFAAYYCGRSVTTFRKEVKAGLFPAPGKTGRYDRIALDEALDNLNESRSAKRWTFDRKLKDENRSVRG